MKAMCSNLVRFSTFVHLDFRENKLCGILVDLISHYVKCAEGLSDCDQCLCFNEIWSNHHKFSEEEHQFPAKFLPNAHTRCSIELCQKRGKRKVSRLQNQERKGCSLNYTSVSLSSSDFPAESNPVRLKTFFVNKLFEHGCLTIKERIELQKVLLEKDLPSVRRQSAVPSNILRDKVSPSQNSFHSIDEREILRRSKNRKTVSFHPTTFQQDDRENTPSDSVPQTTKGPRYATAHPQQENTDSFDTVQRGINVPEHIEQWNNLAKTQTSNANVQLAENTVGTTIQEQLQGDTATVQYNTALPEVIDELNSVSLDEPSPSTQLSLDGISEDFFDGLPNIPIMVQEHEDQKLSKVHYGSLFELNFRTGVCITSLISVLGDFLSIHKNHNIRTR